LRYYAQATLEALMGGPAPFDVHASNDAILAAAGRWLGKPVTSGVASRGAAAASSGDEE
jgi:hypothetical protein